MRNLAIELKNISITKKRKKVLNNISLNIQEGRVYGFVDCNNSGKDTFLKTLTGLIPPKSGEICFNGTKISKRNFPKNVGYILDNNEFPSRGCAFKYLKKKASNASDISDNRIKEVLKTVGLDPDNKENIGSFTAEMKQRLAFAQLMMNKPSIIILDEPTRGMDHEGINLFRNIILDLNEKNNSTVVIGSNTWDDIDVLCDEVYVMDNGELIAG